MNCEDATGSWLLPVRIAPIGSHREPFSRLRVPPNLKKPRLAALVLLAIEPEAADGGPTTEKAIRVMRHQVHGAASAIPARLYNASTVLTLLAGVVICYVALYVVNLAWALFVLDPDLMGSYVGASLGYGDLFVLAWFVASAATVGGGLGSGLESDEAIRAAAYSKREQDRRDRLARDRHPE